MYFNTFGRYDLLTSHYSIAGSLGLTICYDLRFPEMYLELTKRGAHILLVPSAFTAPTGSAHWHILLRGKLQ
jgi:predicted amidohydrolase